MYQGLANQAALAKGHVNNMCISSSSNPHLAQRELISYECLPAFLPVGRALLISLQAKVWILGAISFAFQACLRRSLVLFARALGCGSPSSLLTCRHSLYALFVLNFPAGVSFQHKISSSSA
jgi:hypothetical protein